MITRRKKAESSPGANAIITSPFASPLQNTQSSSKDQETEITWDSSSPSPVRCVLSKGKRLKRLALGSHNRRSSSVSELVRVLSTTSSYNENRPVQQKPKTPLLGIWMNKENQVHEDANIPSVTSKHRKLSKKAKENRSDKFLKTLQKVADDLDNSNANDIDVDETIECYALPKQRQMCNYLNELETTPVKKYSGIGYSRSPLDNCGNVSRTIVTDDSNSMLKPQLPMVGESPSYIKKLENKQYISRFDMAIGKPKNSVTDNVGLKTASEVAFSSRSDSNGKERLDFVVSDSAHLINCVDSNKNSENTATSIMEISKSNDALTDFELFCQNDTSKNVRSEDLASNEKCDDGNVNAMVKDHNISITDEVLLAVVEDAIWDEGVSDEMLIKCTQEFSETPTEGCAIENDDNYLNCLSAESTTVSSSKEDSKKIGNSTDINTNTKISGSAITLASNYCGNDLELTAEDEELLLALTS